MAKNRNDTGLEAIRIESGLLSSSLITLLRRYQLSGQTAENYDVEKGLKLSDELGRYWRIAQARWQQFSEMRQRADLDHDTLTVENWLLPLFNRVLGYQIEQANPVHKAERYFPISHTAFDGLVPFVFTGPEYALDKGAYRFGEEGHKRSPSGLLQEYINADERCLWAIVSNGLTVRLLRDNPAMTRPAYVEIDLERLFEEELYVDFTVFWLLLQATRLAPQDNGLENSYLEQWRSQGQSDGERVLGQLRHGVTRALRTIGTGFVAHPDNHELREKIKSGEFTTDQFFQELLRLIYRLLFLLTTEDRGVLLDPSSSEASRKLYQQGYSIGLLRDRARFRRHHDVHGDAWQQLLIAFAGFGTGQPLLAQPALGGLFAADQCRHLDKAQLANRYLYTALFRLCYFEAGGVLSRVNYRDMDTEELGSIYESLLELIPQLSMNGQWQFGFVGDAADENNTAGHARKLTGSYYTPDSLVQELIKSALEPVIAQRLSENPTRPREALLGMSVCDPACGSGHFLLAAARRLAAELARIEAGTDQSTDAHYRHAIREVVSHCIYGVDINPLAVELCRMALWLEAVEPGKPLGFLDAHIRVGNSLVGVLDPNILKAGIPDKAFQPLTGDDREIATQLKTRNRMDVQQKQLFSDFAVDISACAIDLAAMPEDNLKQVEQKRDAWMAMLYGDSCQSEKLRADLYAAAFFAPKTPENSSNVPTNMELAALERGDPLSSTMRRHVASLADEHRFFHWHLAFPEVFEKGGFDVLLGNPPWDMMQFDPKEFFAQRNSEIANARHMSARNKLIGKLALDDKRLYNEYQKSQNAVLRTQAFVHASGRFPLTSRGRINLAPLFAEFSTQAHGPKGRAGIIVPSGIATDSFTQHFFRFISGKKKLISLHDFENREALFPGVHRSYKFCLLTLGDHREAAQLSFFASQPSHLKNPRRSCSLTADDFSLMNPNTHTCPVFRSQKDAELTKKIYRIAPPLVHEASADNTERNPWGITFQLMFMMNTASYLFRTYDDFMKDNGILSLQEWQAEGKYYLPLYEAKMVHQYDHRWATYETNGVTSRDCTVIDKQDLVYHNLPRYWVDSWQVTLRTANAPKAVLDAAKTGSTDEVVDRLSIWTAGKALLEGDYKKAEELLNEPQINFKQETSDKKQMAIGMAEGSPLKNEEYRKLLSVLSKKLDPWAITKLILENRRPSYLLGWRDICRSTDERTVIASIVPLSAVGHTYPLIFPTATPNQITALLANLNSLVFDYVARQKIGGTHLTFGYIKQIPALPPDHYTKTDYSFIIPRVLELTYTSHALKPFAEDLDYAGEPFTFNPERRHQHKCELDAYFARLYKLTREDLRYILDPADVMGEDYPSETFRVLKNKEMNEYGEYRTQRLVLEAWDKIEAETRCVTLRVYEENPQVFPWPGREEFVYYLIPYLVSAREGMDFDYYRDAAILTSRPENFNSLLPSESLKSFNGLPKAIYALCSFPSDQQLRSRQIRRRLTANRKIKIDPNDLVTKPGSDTRLKEFEVDLSQLVPFIFEAADVLRQFQSDTREALDERQRQGALQASQFIQKTAA